MVAGALGGDILEGGGGDGDISGGALVAGALVAGDILEGGPKDCGGINEGGGGGTCGNEPGKLTTYGDRKAAIPTAASTAPKAAPWNQSCSDGSSKWLMRRVTPIRPSTYSGMKAK